MGFHVSLGECKKLGLLLHFGQVATTTCAMRSQAVPGSMGNSQNCGPPGALDKYAYEKEMMGSQLGTSPIKSSVPFR